MISLDDMGVKLGLKQSSVKNDYLNKYEDIIEQRWKGKCNIVVISNEIPCHLPVLLSERFKTSKIIFMSYGSNFHCLENTSSNSISELHFSSMDELITRFDEIGSPDVIIEHSSNKKSHKLKLFKELFLFLNNGGVYCIEELHAKFISQLSDCDGDDVLDYLARIINLKISPNDKRSQEDQFSLSLADHSGMISFENKLAIILKKGITFKGLRNKRANELLDINAIDGTRIQSSDIPSLYISKNKSSSNLQEKISQHPNEFKISASYINKYNNVFCSPGQIISSKNYLLPDSFRMQHHKSLANRHIKSLGNYFYSIPNIEHSKRLEGQYLFLDSEYPRHFGHFTTEVVSRLWAWPELKAKHQDLKVLLSSAKGKSLPEYAKKILNSYGINDCDIETFDENVIVECVYTASPYYVIGSHVHPDITFVWDKISKGVEGGTPQIHGQKLFIARPVGCERKCLNPEKLEQFFQEAGFEFFHPENHSWEDQIKTFAQAKYIAGYAGSGMFNSMFCKDTSKIIIIGSDTYVTKNEHFICSIKDFELDYIWGNSLIKHGKSWSLSAFMSDYNFDYERDEIYLKEILENL